MDSLTHTLTVSLPSEPIYLVGDPTRITQVVLNLLNNAAKFTPRGGHIWLGAERVGNEARIYVRDTGIGIPAEHLSRIFEMFSQVTPPIERAAEGLGIGLALAWTVGTSRRIHTGEQCRPGKGSEFIVRLPLARADDSSIASPLAGSESACAGS